MRFHVIGLPHTHTTKDFAHCAYTNKVIGFCRMMTDLGHEVFLYAGEQNEAPCTEHIVCISESWRADATKDCHYTAASFNTDLNHWRIFNANVIQAIASRIQQKDFLCVISGVACKPVTDFFPAHHAVEFGIGYGGVYSKFRVFESYAWMHSMYGAASGGNACDVDGRWYDTVIPGYLDIKDFPVGHKKDGYLLYVGRLIDRKGVLIAAQVANVCGIPLKIVGAGVMQALEGYKDIELIGELRAVARNKLMSGAIALLAPTQYIEPFGNVAIEAMACGTPVISTDWGAFTETVIQGVTGYRCRTLKQFVRAVGDAHHLSPATIRKHVADNYDLPVIGKKYEEYFQSVMDLWGEGWNTLPTFNLKVEAKTDAPVTVKRNRSRKNGARSLEGTR